MSYLNFANAAENKLERCVQNLNQTIIDAGLGKLEQVSR